MNASEIKNITFNLYRYAKEMDFSGWDPFDGLNSRLFQATPFNRVAVCRLAWIQFFKRCPINFRPFCFVPPGRNPKGIALFASAALNFYRSTGNKQYLDDALDLFDWLSDNYSKGYSGFAWGYNFPWQSRIDLKPVFFPTIVTTSFVALSFLDGYDRLHNGKLLKMASSAADFILKDLNVHKEGDASAFSYGPDPNDQSRVYNATALGGQLFARLYKTTGDKSFLTAAINAFNFLVLRQQKNGSWFYGDDNTQNWIDNFHTGYNLIALKKFREFTGDQRYTGAVHRGFEFYKNELFTSKGAPKYFSHSYFPVDIHTCAVSILMFLEFNMPDRAKELAEWTINKMWNKKGYFNYQINGFFKTQISYMRWSQAWMLYTLTKICVYLIGR